MKKAADRQEQYTRRNCLLIHHIEEKDDENTNDTVLEVMKDDLGVDISIDDLDRSHLLGGGQAGGQ